MTGLTRRTLPPCNQEIICLNPRRARDDHSDNWSCNVVPTTHDNLGEDGLSYDASACGGGGTGSRRLCVLGWESPENDTGSLGSAMSGGRRGTLDSSVGDINRSVMANTTPVTAQIDEWLGVADNGM
ncbi:hypothetical protein GUJ93_ZPchr0004g39624 [Zizania palustris]|uniref:Uncharacterized protein n=1 Tax=Zizania palustris TaxID=103762 RepID=A0A8J5SQV8_ZIZPA|nr:hypothetical protein GUJ93_ZPchr0004g39624 [Zizania palustris]